MLNYIRSMREDHDVLVSFIAIFVGLSTGLAVAGFVHMIDWVQQLMLGVGDPVELAEGMPAWRMMLLPVIGGAVVALLLAFVPKDFRGYGVTEVIQALHSREHHRLHPRPALLKLLAASVTIGSGGSVGKEGPSVEIGALIGDFMARTFRVPAHMREEVKVIMIGSGAASAIAAVFNSPFGGVTFAMEIILSHMHLRISSPIFLASATGAIVSTTFIGHEVIHLPDYHFVSYWEIGTYLGLAVLVALVASMFTRSLQAAHGFFRWLPVPDWSKPILGGMVIGAILVPFPHVYGTGIEAVAHTLREEFSWSMLLMLVFVKILATAVTVGSRGSGGLFGPALFIGAVSGGAYGMLVHRLLPAVTASSGAYAVVGMGAVLGTVSAAPITATILIFDLTHDYRMILPVAIVTLTATFLSLKARTESIYTVKG